MHTNLSPHRPRPDRLLSGACLTDIACYRQPNLPYKLDYAFDLVHVHLDSNLRACQYGWGDKNLVHCASQSQLRGKSHSLILLSALLGNSPSIPKRRSWEQLVVENLDVSRPHIAFHLASIDWRIHSESQSFCLTLEDLDPYSHRVWLRELRCDYSHCWQAPVLVHNLVRSR